MEKLQASQVMATVQVCSRMMYIAPQTQMYVAITTDKIRNTQQ
jgi:hypothetical protein